MGPLVRFLVWRDHPEHTLDAKATAEVVRTLLRRAAQHKAGANELIHAFVTDPETIDSCRRANALSELGVCAWCATALMQDEEALPVALEWLTSREGHDASEPLRGVLLRSRELLAARSDERRRSAFTEAVQRVIIATVPERVAMLKIARDIQTEVFERHFADVVTMLKDGHNVPASRLQQLRELDVAQAIDASDTQRSANAARKLVSRMRDKVEEHFEKLQSAILAAADLVPSGAGPADLIDEAEVAAVVRAANWRVLGVSPETATAALALVDAGLPAETPVPLGQSLFEALADEGLAAVAPHALVRAMAATTIQVPDFLVLVEQDRQTGVMCEQLAAEGHLRVARLIGSNDEVNDAENQWRQRVTDEARRLRALLGSPAIDFLKAPEVSLASEVLRQSESQATDGWAALAVDKIRATFEALDRVSRERRSDLELNRALAQEEIESVRMEIRHTRGASTAAVQAASAFLDLVTPRTDALTCDLSLVEDGCRTARAVATDGAIAGSSALERWGAALLLPDLESVPERRLVADRAWDVVRGALGLPTAVYAVSPDGSERIAASLHELLRRHFDALDELLREDPPISFERAAALRRAMLENIEQFAALAPDAEGIELILRAAHARATVSEWLADVQKISVERLAPFVGALQDLTQCRPILGIRSDYLVEGARALIDARVVLGAQAAETVGDVYRDLDESYAWLEVGRPDPQRVLAVYCLVRVHSATGQREAAEALQLIREHSDVVEALVARDPEVAGMFVREREALRERAQPSRIRLSEVQLDQLGSVGGSALTALMRTELGSELRPLTALESEIQRAGPSRRRERRELYLKQAAVIATHASLGDPSSALPVAALRALARAATDEALIATFESPTDVARIDSLVRAALNLSHRAQLSVGASLRIRLLVRLVLAGPHVDATAVAEQAEQAKQEALAAGIPLTDADEARMKMLGAATVSVLHATARAQDGDVAGAQQTLNAASREIESSLAGYPELQARVAAIDDGEVPPRIRSAPIDAAERAFEVGAWQRVVAAPAVPAAARASAATPAQTNEEWATAAMSAAKEIGHVRATLNELRARVGIQPGASLDGLLAGLDAASDARDVDLRARSVVDNLESELPDVAHSHLVARVRRWVRRAVQGKVGPMNLECRVFNQRLEVTELGRATVALALRNAGAPIDELELALESLEPGTEVLSVEPAASMLARGEERFVVVRVLCVLAPGSRTELVVRWKGIGIAGDLASGESRVSLEVVRYRDVPIRYVTGSLDPSQHSRLYFGRDLEERAFAELLLPQRQTSIPFLFGMNRVGKSSVLRFATSRHLPAATVFSLEISFNSVGPQVDANSFYARLSQLAWESAGRRAIEFKASPDTSRGYRVLTVPSISGEETVGVLEAASVGWQAFRATLDEIVRCTGKVALLLLDDFDRIGDILPQRIDPSVIDPLAELATRPEFRIALASGLPIDAVRAFFMEPGTKLLRNSQPIHVSFLRRPELDQVVTKPVADDGIVYTQEALDALWHWTGGYAFQAQHLCSDIQLALNADARKLVQGDDVSEQLTKRLALSSTTMVDPFRSSQLLTGLAADLVWNYLHGTNNETPWTRERFRESVPTRGDAEVDGVLANLIHREILQEAAGASGQRTLEMRNNILASWLLAHPTQLGRQPERPTDPLRRAGERLHAAFYDARAQLEATRPRRGDSPAVFEHRRDDTQRFGQLRREADLENSSLADLLSLLYMTLWEPTRGQRAYLRESHPKLFMQLVALAGLRNYTHHRYDTNAAADVEEMRRNEAQYQKLVRRVHEPPNSPAFNRHAKILVLTDLAEAFEAVASALRRAA